MTSRAERFLILYRLRQSEILSVSERFADALDEDRVKNAEMFDITRTDFSKNQHPNATMRALENDLLQKDVRLLALLCALSDTAMEIKLGLADLNAEDFIEACAALFEKIEENSPVLGHLAQKLTEIKAEYAVDRLTLAIERMSAPGKDGYHENY